MCQLLFSMTNSIKVVRKELNGVTKIINEIALCNEILIFLVVFLNFFLVTVEGFSAFFIFLFRLYFKSNALFFSISHH